VCRVRESVRIPESNTKNISLLIFGGVCGIINLSTGGVLPPVFFARRFVRARPHPCGVGIFL